MKYYLLPSAEVLRTIFRADFVAGKLYWQEKPDNARRNRVFGGREAGCLDGKGYVRIRTEGKIWLAHRILWKMRTGQDADIIDHIDGNRANNSEVNLRSVSAHDNALNCRPPKNNTSGAVGVRWVERDKLWVARIGYRRKQVVIGYFKSFDEALTARKAAERELGFHPNHGQTLSR